MNKRKTAGKKKEHSKDNNTRIKERKMQAYNLQSRSDSGKHISKRYGENRRKLKHSNSNTANTSPSKLTI